MSLSEHITLKCKDPSLSSKRKLRREVRSGRRPEGIRHLLNITVRDGKLPSNPALKLQMFKEHSGHTRFLSQDEEQTLYQMLGPIYCPWVRFAILTGLRRAEQFGLRWSDVDVEKGILTYPTKAGGVQYVHLNAEAPISSPCLMNSSTTTNIALSRSLSD